jgi:hypothetical protein
MKRREGLASQLFQPFSDGPPWHQWLFGDRERLPEEETEAAYCWEFGLQTPEVVAEVEVVRQKLARYKKRDAPAFRKWMEENPRPDDIPQLRDWVKRCYAANPDSDLTSRMLDLNAGFMIHWPEFPGLHWLQVPQAVREDKTRKWPLADDGDWRCKMWKPGYWEKQMEAREFGTAPSFFYKTKFGLACHTWIHSWLVRAGANLE